MWSGRFCFSRNFHRKYLSILHKIHKVLFNKTIISYSFPGYYYGVTIIIIFLIRDTFLSYSQTEKSTGWHLCSHFGGNLCRRIVYSGQCLARKGCSSEFCFALFSSMTSSDIPPRKMGMQKTVKAKAQRFIIYVEVYLTLSLSSIHSYLSRSNILGLLLESYVEIMVAYRSLIRAVPSRGCHFRPFDSENLGYLGFFFFENRVRIKHQENFATYFQTVLCFCVLVFRLWFLRQLSQSDDSIPWKRNLPHLLPSVALDLPPHLTLGTPLLPPAIPPSACATCTTCAYLGSSGLVFCWVGEFKISTNVSSSTARPRTGRGWSGEE